MKKHNDSRKKSEPTSKRAKTRGPMRRDTKEVLAELVVKLKESWIRKRWQQRVEKRISAVSFAPISTVWWIWATNGAAVAGTKCWWPTRG